MRPSVFPGLVAFSLLPLCLVACISGPDLSHAPRVEMHFPVPPRTAKPAAPKADKPKEAPLTAPAEYHQAEPPDPPARASRTQLELELTLAKRKLSCSHAKRVTFATEHVTPRRFGRFALEAYEGGRLVERLRFDFPLLLDTPERDEMEAGLETEVRLEFPDLPGVTRLEVRDRKTGEIVVLPSAGKLVQEPFSGTPPPAAPAAAK